jgi:hypothetical protein
LVAKGYSQRKGVDFFDTWAPTARHTTARILLHFAAVHDYHVHVMDVDQAFLQGELEEELFMELPPVLPAGARDGKVWRLKRPLYGLKQAPRQWQKKLKDVLGSIGLRPSASDPSLYLGHGPDGTWLLVYVDDLLIVCKTLEAMETLKGALKEVFLMKDLGPIKDYLGMAVSRDRDRHEITLSQERYITDIASRFDLLDSKPVASPLPQHHGLALPSDDDEPCPTDRFPELVGSLMYAMVCTRPDIAHAVSVLSRFVAPGRHSARHWAMGLRVVSYLYHTRDRVLVLGGEDSTLQGWSDASWADDAVDRKSSQGYCWALGRSMISWKASRSPSVALSTCEAELYAGTAAAQEALWLMQLLEELGVQKQVPVLWCDNESTLALTKDPVYSARCKHIAARYFFIRELTEKGVLIPKHIASQQNVADIFTKALPICDHDRHCDALGVHATPC